MFVKNVCFSVFTMSSWLSLQSRHIFLSLIPNLWQMRHQNWPKYSGLFLCAHFGPNQARMMPTVTDFQTKRAPVQPHRGTWLVPWHQNTNSQPPLSQINYLALVHNMKKKSTYHYWTNRLLFCCHYDIVSRINIFMLVHICILG